jgi:hypothetical protein
MAAKWSPFNHLEGHSLADVRADLTGENPQIDAGELEISASQSGITEDVLEGVEADREIEE